VYLFSRLSGDSEHFRQRIPDIRFCEQAESNGDGAGLLHLPWIDRHWSGFWQLMALAVDSSGDVYVTGGTAATNFPVTAGAFQTQITMFPTMDIRKLTRLSAS